MEQTVILSHLLDKFEKSKHLSEPGTSKRRVILRIDKKELPEYDYQDAETRDAFNAAAKALEQQGLIATQWLKDRPVLSCVSLNLDHVTQCYQMTGRTHPKARAGGGRDGRSATFSCLHGLDHRLEGPDLRGRTEHDEGPFLL
jgi:hypothetical protein